MENHSIFLENNSLLTVTGVEDIDEFDGENINIRLTDRSLEVTGIGLKVKELVPDDGKLMIEGDVRTIKYTGRKRSEGGFWSKVFK